MSISEQFLTEDLHPIDLVEHLATYYDWEFDRVGDDQIAMVVEGQWRTYSITLAWSDFDETLRMICTFELEPPKEKLDDLHRLINKVNDQCWVGAFTFWEEQKLMVYRYGLVSAVGQGVVAEQVDKLIAAAVAAAERYYPAFQLIIWGNRTPEQALDVAIAEAYGTA